MFNQLEPIYDENVKMLRQIASQQIKIIKKVIDDVFLVELIKEKTKKECDYEKTNNAEETKIYKVDIQITNSESLLFKIKIKKILLRN